MEPVTSARGSLGKDFWEDYKEATIGLTYSTTSDISRVKHTLGALVVCIIQVVYFLVADGSAHTNCIEIKYWGTAGHLNVRTRGTDFELSIDSCLRACVENNIRMGLRIESAFLNGHCVGTKRKVRKNVIAIVVAVHRAVKPGLGILDGDL